MMMIAYAFLFWYVQIHFIDLHNQLNAIHLSLDNHWPYVATAIGNLSIFAFFY